MYFDLDDYRPDTPRTPPVISVREGVLLSIIVHLVCVVAVLLMPKWVFEASPLRPVPADQAPIKFVSIAPRIDRPAPPKLTAEQSDLDRQSATREQAPKPENVMPFSRGNTPEKVEGARAERAAGPDTPQPATSTSASSSELAPKVLPDTPVVAKPTTGGALGDQLRNLKKYLQGNNFDNDRGGQTNKAPDIQFDSKGVDFGEWIRRFRAQVMSNWFIPETAMFLHGHVVLQFNVHRDGSITDLTIVQPSSVDSFTSAAFNAMKLTAQARTQPLPPEYPAEKVLFTVTFFYNERNQQ